MTTHSLRLRATSRSCRRHGTAVLLAVTAFGCGDGRPTKPDLAWMPAEYRPHAPAGKLISSGNPSLDFWNNINLQLALLDRGSRDGEHQIAVARSHATAIRQRPTAGVDPELVDWAKAVARMMEAGAAVLEEAAAIRQRGLDPADNEQLRKRHAELELDAARLAAIGRELRSTLTKRHGRDFPPSQLD